MPIRQPRPRLVALGALALAALVPAAPARADCQPAGPLEDELRTAPVAFVGRVVATEGPVARFAVAEVWAGAVDAEVEVRGLSDLPLRPGEAIGRPAIEAGEDDRTWQAATTYLVVPFVDGTVLRDHICSPTTEWVADLARLRPPDARILAEEGEPVAARPPLVPLAVAGVLTAAVVVSVLAFRTRARDRS